MLKKWEELPSDLQVPEVRPYWEALDRKRVQLAVKRAGDLVLAVLLLVLLAIPMAVIAVLIRLDSEGPVFYRQERVTRYGKHFRIHKFRTMVVNAEQLGSAVTTGHDKRITKIGSRLRGFSAAEEFAEEPVEADGRTTQVVSWKLVPEPCADEYKIRPFVVAVAKGAADLSFAAGPVYFRNPADRERAEGGIEIDPEKDLPPLSWRLVGWIALAVLAAALVFAAAFFAVRYLSRRVKEHFMSPIERAWAELGRLLAKGLPGRGRYKDFYVELTMVVRRYVQRRYGIRAPHLTTEEFLRELGSSGRTDRAKLAEFLENADLVKFAGIEATPEMADQATGSARDYLRSDSAIDGRGGGR